ncbi:hypothetical protein B0I35DRAFT_426047, partial [Stachybotrys elegans]
MGGFLIDGVSPTTYARKALTALRLRVDRGEAADDWLLLSIYCLAAIEFWTNSPPLWSRQIANHNTITHKPMMQAAHIHLNALVRLVKEHGGWKCFDPYLLESSVLIDKYLAISELASPTIPLTWDPGPTPPASPAWLDGKLPWAGTNKRPFQIENTALHCRITSPCPIEDAGLVLGGGFRQHGVDKQLLEVLFDIAQYIQFATCLWHSRETMTDQQESWLFHRLQALIYRLLALDQLLNPLDECTRLAGLVFILSTIDHRGAHIAAVALLSPLRDALNRMVSETEAFDLQFWCLCVGAMADDLTIKTPWFLEQVAKRILDMGIDTDRDALERRLHSFLYIPSRQRWKLELLCCDARERRC